MLPNGANVPGVQAIGHVDPAGGGARNAFGEQFWSEWVNKFGWNSTFCCMDSDSDGQTNGMELGDPCKSTLLYFSVSANLSPHTHGQPHYNSLHQAACGR